MNFARERSSNTGNNGKMARIPSAGRRAATLRHGLGVLGTAFQEFVDVSAGIEQLVGDHDGSHQHQPLVADIAVIARQFFEFAGQILADLLKALNLVLATCETIAPPVEVDRNVSQ